MNMHRNKSRFFRFIARFLGAKKAASAPAFLVAAGLATFAAAPAYAATTVSIDASVTEGDYSADNLAFGSGQISFGGTAAASVADTTTLSARTELTIESSGAPLDFGKLQFQAPDSVASVTVAARGVVFASVQSSNNYGKIAVNENAQLTITGDAALSRIEASGELNFEGEANVQTLVAKTGGNVTLANAGGVTVLSMQGGVVNVSDFALDHVQGSSATATDAAGSINASGALTVNEDVSLTAADLNLSTRTGGSVTLKEGSSLDLGSGDVSLAAGTTLTIGDAGEAAKSETLKAERLVAEAGATTVLNGGTLELTGDGITQNLDSLDAGSSGLVDVSGEDAIAKFTAAKTFAGELDLQARAGTLEVADGVAVSTAGTVDAKNLTIGSGAASVKATAFTLGEEGTLTMRGGTLDLSATNGSTNIYGIAEGSSGEITEIANAGTIVLNKSASAGALKFTATNNDGGLTLAGTAEAPITVETSGAANVRNLDVGANTLIAGNVSGVSGTTGLTLTGGTLIGTNVTIQKIVDGAYGKIAASNAGTVEIDPRGTGTTTGALVLGDENTNKIHIKGNQTLTLGAGSVVTATGTEPGTNGLIVGGTASGINTILDLSADDILLKVNAIKVDSTDTLKLSGTQVVGSDATPGKITLGDAQSLITTRGQLKSLGQTTMNAGTIESTGADIAATETSDPVYAIELGDVSMGNGVIKAAGGTAKVGVVSDQGVIGAKNILLVSISDSAANKVWLTNNTTNGWGTPSDSVTFTGTGSVINQNGDSKVVTKKLALAAGAEATIGSTTRRILDEGYLNVVELGEGAALTTATSSNGDNGGKYNRLTSVSLAAGTADDKTAWSHTGSDLVLAGTLSMGDYSKLEVQKNLTVTTSNEAVSNATADVEAGSNVELVSSEESVTVSGDLTAGDDLMVSAAKNVSVTGATNVGDSAAITAGTAATGGDITLTGDATFGADATLTAGTDTTNGNITFNNDATFDTGATLTASQAVTAAGDLTTENADGETVGDLTINAGTSATVEGDLTTGDDLAITAAQNVTVKGNTSAGDRATLTATAGDIALGDDADADATTFGENATLTAGQDILLKGETSFDQGATLAATRAVTAVGSLEIANNSEVTATNGAIDLSGAELKLGNSEITLKTESATAGDVLLSKVSGINGLAVAKVDAAKNIVFKNDASADVDVQAGLGLDAQEIVVEDGANVQIVNGFVNTRNRLTKVSVGAGATFDLRGNNNELAGTPAVVPHKLTAVELADGGTLVVGGVNPLGEDVYVTYATATSVANALPGVTGTIVVAGNGTGANDAPIHSTLTAGTVGSVATGGVNVTLNEGGELVATAGDMHVAALNGTGGALTASDGTTKHDVVVTASNALGQNIAITADELRVTDLANDGTDVTVTLSKLDLSNVDSLAVADAYADTASHSTLEITETAGEDGAQLDWTHLDVSVGETVGAETRNGTLKLTQGTNVAIGELAVVGDASVLEIDGSALEAASVAGDALAGTLKLTDGALTLTDDADVTFANAALSDGTLTVNGDATFTNALAAGASGTIEANDVSFMAGTGSTGALTLNAGVSRDAEGEIVGADGQVNFSGESAFGEGSEINAKTIFASNFGTNFTADATEADVNFLENVSAVGAVLKTAEDFTGADDAKAALKNVSVHSGGVFENDGDLTIEDSLKLGWFATAGTVRATGDVFVDAPITDNAFGTPGAAVGTIEGANVEINLTEQLSGPGIANTLEITATATDGAITLSGATDGAEFVFDAKLTAEKLVVGTTAGEGETEVSTQVKITNPDEALAGVASEIEINELDSLRLVQAWSPAQNNLTVTNAGTLTLDGKLTVSAGKSFSVAGGQSEFKDGVENNGAFALTDAASATAKTWTDAATGATLSLTGTQTANAKLTVSEGDTTINSELSASNAELTQTAGSLAIAGGAGTTVENLTIRTLEADKTISFTTNAFDASGKVTVSTVAGATDADKVQVAADVSLGEASSITTTTLDVADDKTASVHGKIAVTNIELNDRGTLTLKGDDLSGDAEASTFMNLENGAGAVVNVLNGATLTQNAGAAAIALNGALNVSGTSADKATFAAAGDMTVAGTGSVALSDYGVLDVGNGTLKLETGATLSLASGAFAEIAALDLTESAQGAVKVDGFGMSANDAATVKVGTLKMKDAIAAGDEGTIQLTDGGKLVADNALGKILVTDHDGAGNIWIDAYSQFELKAGNIVVTEETRGEIIASSGNVVFEQKAAGSYELSGVGTENLSLPAQGRQSLTIRIAEYYDDAVPEYTYSHVDVRRATSLTNADLTIEDIERDASTADRTLGDLGNASFNNSTLTVTGVAANEENLDERVTLEVSEGLKLTNNSRATISDIELAGASGFSVALSGNSSLTATDATISGFDRVSLNDADFKADGATLKGVDLWVDNSGQLSVADGGLELADGAVVSINNGGSLELKGDVATTDDESALVLNGGNVAVAAANVEVSRLSVSSNSAIEADDGAGDEPTLTLANANVTSDATLGVSGVAIDAGTLTLDAGGALNSDETVDVDTLNLNGGALSSTGDVSVTNAVADAKGKISADTLTLKDGLSGDGVEIDADTLALQGTLSGDVNAGDIGQLKIASGTEATLSGGDLSFDALATNVEGSLTVSDSAEVSLGELTASDLTLSGATAKAESATITDLTLDDGALVATGDVEIENAVADASGSISGADVALNGVSEAAGGQVDLTASGTLTLGGTAAVSGAVSAGTLAVEGDATLSGEVSAGVTNVSGSLTLDGSETVSLGELAASDLTLSGATANAESATITDLTLSGGALVAPGDVEIENAVADASGSISGADVTLNGVSEAAGDQVDLTASGTLTLRNETTIENGSVDAGTLAVEGDATLSGEVSADETNVSGSLTIDGAADVALGAATVFGDGELIVRDSTVSGDFGFDADADGAKISIDDSTVNGNVTLSGEGNELGLKNATINGDLVAGEGTVTIAGENSAETISLSDAKIVQEAGSTLTATSILVKDYELAAGATVESGVTVKGGSAAIAGTVNGNLTLNDVAAGTNSTLSGTVTGALKLENGSVLSTSGTVTGATAVKENSELTQTGGTLADVSVNASTFAQNGGTAASVTLENGATFTQTAGDAGAVDATRSTVTIRGTVASIDAVNSEVTVSGAVNGSTAVKSGSELVSTGTLADVSVNDATFTQNDGAAASVTLTNGATLTQNAGSISELEVAVDATAKLGGSTTNLKVAGTVEATADQSFTKLTLDGGSIVGGENEISVAQTVENANGAISGKNVSLNGGLTGSASVSATDTLTLGGATETSGALSAGTLLVEGTLTAKSSQVSADATSVAGTLNLAVDTDAVSGLSVSGAANLASENRFALSLDGGNGTVNKTGSGALALGDAAGFTGTLNVAEGDAALTAGKTFGGDVNFASGTFTGGAGAKVAGTLAMGAGTTLEIGDRGGEATFTVGKLVSARTRSAETTAVVHDLYAADSIDVLKVTDATTDLSGFTAIVRSNLVNERELGAEGLTLDLIDGAVASGYGSVAGEGFEFVNLALAGDGTRLSVSLNYRGAASGLGGDAFSANQRSVAGALPVTADGRLGDYLDALNASGSAAETARALDAMGATHLVSMMPAQITGTWNHVQSLNNAIGQSSIIGDFEQKFGAWAQYVGSSNDVDATSDRKGWKRTMSGGMVGFEYAASPKFLLGAAVGYEDSKLKSAGNTTDDSAYFLDFYLRGRAGKLTHKASLTFAQHNYDADRSMSVGAVGDRVTGSTDGFSLAGNYELSYGHALNKYVSLHPLATVSAAFNSIDGWTESGAGNASLSYEDSEAWTFLAGVGARAEFRLPILNSDIDLMPTLGVHAVLMGEFGDRSDELRARFTGSGASFRTDYDDSSACMLDLGVTLAAPITERVSVIGGISSRIRSDETNMNANLGVRIGW
ncbi:hypothetical protein [Candidatus Spyradosoma sp. SGI.093]|uniref:hypothetical protein n=1 Tax=Candidatus Spyradosoma sp. SGI.093 TaxID=3420583 RepID=UPI003CFBCCEA